MKNYIGVFNFILLLSFHTGRHSNLLFQELRKNRKSLTMTQIHGKEYGVNQEMFNVSNLLFTNQSMFSKTGRVPSIIQVIRTFFK